MPAKSAPIPSTAQKLPSKNDREAVPIKTPVRSDVGQTQPATGKTAPKHYGELPADADKGLSQTALGESYGLKAKNLKRDSAVAGFDTLEGYLKQMTGIDWRHGKTEGMTKLYFPVAE